MATLEDVQHVRPTGLVLGQWNNGRFDGEAGLAICFIRDDVRPEVGFNVFVSLEDARKLREYLNDIPLGDPETGDTV